MFSPPENHTSAETYAAEEVMEVEEMGDTGERRRSIAGNQLELRCADATRGIPARSLVMARLVHSEASSRRATCFAELWPSSSTSRPSGLSNAAACAISGA